MTERAGKVLDPKQVLATNLREFRERHGLSQERLAEALRGASALAWTQATVADVELGERHLRTEEVLALALFFRVGPEDLLTPVRGQVRLGEGILADRERLLKYLTARRGLKQAAYALLPKGRGVERFSGFRTHAPITRKGLQDEERWNDLGGDISDLRRHRDLLWQGKITPQQYAAWRRHAADRLRRLHASIGDGTSNPRPETHGRSRSV